MLMLLLLNYKNAFSYTCSTTVMNSTHLSYIEKQKNSTLFLSFMMWEVWILQISKYQIYIMAYTLSVNSSTTATLYDSFE